jgi:PIN domain nuclease of toxin-antitoxin system
VFPGEVVQSPAHHGDQQKRILVKIGQSRSQTVHSLDQLVQFQPMGLSLSRGLRVKVDPII